MDEIVRLYFQYADGTDDSIIIDGHSIDAVNKKVELELFDRDATFTGIECLQQCD